MTCFFCGRLPAEEQLPRGWKTCGRLVACRTCRRQYYRLRLITMAVSEPIGCEWRQFIAAVEEAERPSTVLAIPGNLWEPTIADGRPFLRISIGNRWWTLRLQSDTWSRGRKAAYASVVSGEALAGELLLYRGPPQRRRAKNGRSGSHWTSSGMTLRTVAWLPLNAPISSRKASIVFRQHSVEEIDIKNLRTAIRANWVSFPSQIPVFPSSASPELQSKLVQLYFVLGWNCADIANRYGIVEQRVRDILHGWKFRAANAGYLQHIPPEQAINQLKIMSMVRNGTWAPSEWDALAL
jgi:hypothetical protein